MCTKSIIIVEFTDIFSTSCFDEITETIICGKNLFLGNPQEDYLMKYSL